MSCLISHELGYHNKVSIITLVNQLIKFIEGKQYYKECRIIYFYKVTPIDKHIVADEEKYFRNKRS